MNRTSLACVTVLFCILSGCKRTDDGKANQIAAGDSPNSPALCKGNCEGVAYIKVIHHGDQGWSPLNLKPEEKDSLKHTLMNTRTSGASDKLHVHADAVDGRIVFSSDNTQDPTHVSGSEPQIAVGTQSPPASSIAAKLVATDNAKKILRERAAVPFD